MTNTNDSETLDSIVDQFSVHQPKGQAKGTVARRILKKRLNKRLDALIASREKKSEIAVIQLILNTCKFEGRELYLSTTAVEMLLTDIELDADKRKALTALNKLKQGNSREEK